MSSAAITPSMRAVGWNIHFIIGREEDPGAFAGVYQVPGSDLVTFRNVCDELRLCFEFPNDATWLNSSDDDDGNDPWASIAFALADPPSLPNSPCPPFITAELLDQSIPSLPPLRPKEQNIVTFHLFHHRHCHLPLDSVLDTHLQGRLVFVASILLLAYVANPRLAKCAQHLPNPLRRRDLRYLPPNKTPSDPGLALMPLRRKLKSRSQSPPKRSASGSLSPPKGGADDVDNHDLENMLAPGSMDIDVNEANRIVNEFRSSCLNRATCCAVSGEGEPWCPGSPIGPGVQACHIVPQHHYHLYPISSDQYEDSAVEDVSPRRLQEAWKHTWNPRNGILLMKHLHEFFDARLFSINPYTFRIRVFVPYNALIRFNGERASVHTTVDRKALRHHYEMCCIENMAAERPNLDATSTSTCRIPTSGTGTPFSARYDLPATPNSKNMQIETVAGRTGDPSKRSRSTPSNQGQGMDASEQGGYIEGEAAQWTDEGRYKRRRLDDRQVGETLEMSEGYVMARNSREFLADVNWELQKFKARQPANN
ncbi:hypothetical protein RRF57_007093 [Xylaria bambusicola]|uniref:HNH nuclease domain-containing protein n=1 Tax=Xylaria bambusicola TaxID=326684 RepID=A0AAN7UUL4_9PEZI